jgi:hypothetical protein
MRRSALQSPSDAFLFFGVITGHEELLGEVASAIVDRWGPLHERGESAVFPFPETATYRATMGPRLLRQFFVVSRRWPQDGLGSVKLESIAIEDAFGERYAESLGISRPVNIDPGLVNDCRVILATTKDRSQRIYRGDGIWEEITLVWQGGAYRAHPWTYPDFRSPAYHEFLATFRAELLREARERD